MKTFATPGYLSAIQEVGVENITVFAPARKAISLLSSGGDPTWVIGDPEIQDNGCHKDDDGRTLKITSLFKFYAIRADHPSGCDCGCGGGSVVTFLLPEEY